MKYKLFFLLLFCNLNLSAQLSISYGSYKQIINDSIFYNDELQIYRNDSIIFYWPSIIGLVKIHQLNKNKISVECLFNSPLLIGDSIQFKEVLFCEVKLDILLNKFEIILDSNISKLVFNSQDPYDSLYSKSRDISKDSILSIKNQYEYFKLAQFLSFDLINNKPKHYERLKNFFIDFPFMLFSQFNLEIVACQNLGNTLLYDIIEEK